MEEKGDKSKASVKKKKTIMQKKRAQRVTSNVFAMFDQPQILEFKEAFNMIDQNRDGYVDKEDLHDMLNSLGKEVTDEYLEEMVGQSPGPLNFTMFLTLFGEKLNGTDPEDVIKNAFACFDHDQKGVVSEDYLRELLTTLGDRFSDEYVDEIFKEAPIKGGNFDYVEFIRILKHGTKEKDEEQVIKPGQQDAEMVKPKTSKSKTDKTGHVDASKPPKSGKTIKN